MAFPPGYALAERATMEIDRYNLSLPMPGAHSATFKPRPRAGARGCRSARTARPHRCDDGTDL